MATLENLNTLKFTDAKRPKNQPPIVQRRNKLISKLWEQLELARAKHNGKDFVIKRYKNVKDLEGNIKSIESPSALNLGGLTAAQERCVSMCFMAASF